MGFVCLFCFVCQALLEKRKACLNKALGHAVRKFHTDIPGVAGIPRISMQYLAYSSAGSRDGFVWSAWSTLLKTI